MLIVLPIAALVAWLAVKLAVAERELIETHRTSVTRQLSQLADLEVAYHIRNLVALASTIDLSGANFEHAETAIAQLKESSKYMRVWAFSKGGAAAPKPLSDAPEPAPGFYDRVLAGETAVTGTRGEGKSAVFSVGVPVLKDDKIHYGLAAEIMAKPFSDAVFKESGMKPDWITGIVDRDNHFVARSLDPDGRLGRLARPELGVAAASQETAGVFQNVTLEGVVVINSFYRSTLTGWTTVVAVPKAVLEAPMNRSLTFLILGGTAALLAALAGASHQARRISEPVRNLSKFASALSEGRPYDEIDDGIFELDQVRSALQKTMAKSAHLSALVASSQDAIVSVARDGTILSWNSGAETLFGYTSQEMVGKPKTLIVPKDRAAELAAEFEQVLAGTAIRFETVRCLRDGTQADVSISSAPIRRPDGTIIAISSIIRDIRDRKAAEDHVRTLMQEVAHRSKNQMAVIQSIANRTAKTAQSVPEFSTNFGKRLGALAASYDLLIERNWTSVKLAELVDRQLAIFTGEDGVSLETQGPDVDLPAAAAEAVGLALHELATNAFKYGAWSSPAGKVSVSWQVTSDAENGAQLDLSWVETGGPIVIPATRRGFGSVVIEAMVASSLQGTAKIDFAPEGVTWRLQCPLPATTRAAPAALTP